MKCIAVASVAEILPGTFRVVEVGDRLIVLCHVEGGIFAVDNACPHAGGPLGEGRLNGPYLECPWHRWRFDVRTGEKPENPEIQVERFPTQIHEGTVSVELPSD